MGEGTTVPGSLGSSSQNEKSISQPMIKHKQKDDTITLGESILSLIMLVVRHKISHVLLADIIRIIRCFCPTPNIFPKTLYKFQKFFCNFDLPTKRHYYCSVCFSKLNNSMDTCKQCPDAEQCYFIELPLVPQLLRLFHRDGFFNLLNARFDRQHDFPGTKDDIWDGEIYKSLSGPNGFLSNRNNISFTWNTDGIDLYKSSKFSIWPFYLTINELPFSLRSQLKNTLICGFWFGSIKPIANVFMNSFRQIIEKIFKGIFIRLPNRANLVKVRGLIICGTCDLPAKACFLNMKAHNAIYGCCKCKIQSQQEGNTRVFPYTEQLDLRTSEETIRQGEEAYETDDAIEGQIKNISPPSFTHRLPRSVSDYKYWKVSELQYWLLYYSLIVLYPFMPTSYYEHHKLLVKSITLLSLQSVSELMIDEASTCIEQYVKRFEDLYGLSHMTCNLHQLRHLPDAVRKFGPLRTTSCFQFENLNGVLKGLINGTRYAQLQIRVTWRPSETTKVTSKFIVVTCTLDAPARAAVVRIKNFNGYFGCTFCYAEGESLSRGKFIYPFSQSYGKLRTDNAAFLGAAKLHITILLTTTKASYYIGHPDVIKIIDKILLSIKPPSRRARTPRSINSYAQWKASEWRNWLDYAPACLKPVLEEKYVNHLALFSEAMHYLNSDSITLSELDRASMLLKEYFKLFEEFFGTEKMTSNIHSLTHLARCVMNWDFSTPAFDKSIASETRDYIVKKLKVVDETVEIGFADKFVLKEKPTIRSLTEGERIVLCAAGYTPEKINIYGHMRLNGIKFSSVNPQLQTKVSNSFAFNERLIAQNFSHACYGFDTQFIHEVDKNHTNFIQETSRIRPAIKITTIGATYAIKLANCWETD
ncbi:Protein of unknown function [Cotesia congregata]|uniref:Transposase domain-containing protein n=1 Tax=Cotesia congregata TaxID=51543 RepID=A0A8J2HGQ9_COTCN|nr:Protein of unknown function [Cotesia congregata]